MENIYNVTLDELISFFLSHGEKKYRAEQVFEWLYRKRVKSFDDMTNLNNQTKELLKAHFCFEFLKFKETYQALDGTIKYLFELKDHNLIETVLMSHNYGYSICVTSEVGCKMGCAFCASGELGFIRVLDVAECVLQILMVDDLLKAKNERISNVVVMGIGEPFDNYDNLMKFLRIINYPKGLEIGARHITVSTSGIVPMITKFAKEDLQINLAISLHAPNNELRNQLMKINKVYPIEDLIESVREYLRITNRRVTFEYILIKGVNDSLKEAEELGRLLKGLNCYVNLILYNEIATKSFKQTDADTAQKFLKYLLDHNITTTFRKGLGSGVYAACGQLRAQTIKNKKKREDHDWEDN